MSQTPKKNSFIQIIAFMGLITLVVLVVLMLSEDKQHEGNAYDLDIDKFNQISPELIRYKIVQEIQVSGSKLRAVAVDSADYIYAATESQIIKYNPYGSLIESIDLPLDLRNLTLDDRGEIYAASKNSVYRIDRGDGTTREIITLTDSSIITSLAVTENHLFLADAGNRIVAHFDTSGQFFKYIGGAGLEKGRPGFVIPSPFFDLAIKDQQLWVVNPGMHRFENYAFDGRLLQSWGAHSARLEGFCGCCNPSHFAVDANLGFVTSEKGLVRVKIYSPSGDLMAVVAGPDQFARQATGLDICIDSNQRILIAEPVSNTVKIFEPQLEADRD